MKTKKLIWDCKRRTDCYNSIDIKLLLRNKGDIYEMTRMLIWDESAKIFEKWMTKTLEIKEEGEKLNDTQKGTGEAMRAFGKGLGNSAYGQTIKNDHDDNVQFVNNIKDKNKFLDENTLNDIICNNEDENGYHVLLEKESQMK